MDKNSIPKKGEMKSREDRLKIALKKNMAKRKSQAKARKLNLPIKNIEANLED